MNFKTSLGRFRIISFVEGISYIILVFICMPIKYIGGNPYPVKVFGSIHGGLFVLYCLLLLITMIERRWKFMTSVWLFLASLIPFGNFIAESMFLKKEALEK